MKTKIVYVVVASKDSIYLEQAYVSVWSLKYYNPDAHVTFVMDDRTKEYWDACQYDELKSMVNDVIVHRFDDNSTNHYRSRWLKTSLRSLIEGDYLFLDTDTVITDNISEIDNFEIENIGAVCDWHQSIDKYPLTESIISNTKYLYGQKEIPRNINYYNSGVFFVRDNDLTHSFYDKWHSLWQSSIGHPNGKYDQPSLFVTDILMGGMIHSIPDDFNYQLSATIRFLHTSKIIHFYNGKMDMIEIHELFSQKPYSQIKLNNNISEGTQNLILNCKSEFNFVIGLLGPNQLELWNSYIFRILKKICGFKLVIWIELFMKRINQYRYRIICQRYGIPSND